MMHLPTRLCGEGSRRAMQYSALTALLRYLRTLITSVLVNNAHLRICTCVQVHSQRWSKET